MIQEGGFPSQEDPPTQSPGQIQPSEQNSKKDSTQGGGSPSRADHPMESPGQIQHGEQQNETKDSTQAGNNPSSEDPLPLSFHNRPTDEEGNIIHEYQDLDMFLEAMAKDRVRKLNTRRKELNTNSDFSYIVVDNQESFNDMPCIWQNFASHNKDRTNDENSKLGNESFQSSAERSRINDGTLKNLGNLTSSSAKKPSTNEETWEEPDDQLLYLIKILQANVEISKQKDGVKGLGKRLQTNEVFLEQVGNLPQHSAKKPRTDDSLKHQGTMTPSSANEYQLNDKVLGSPEDPSSNSLKNPDSNDETSKEHDDRSPNSASLARKPPTNEEILKGRDVPSQNTAKCLQSNETSKQPIDQPQSLTQKLQTNKKRLEGEDDICQNPAKRHRIEEKNPQIPSSSNISQINAPQNPVKRPGGNDLSQIASKRSRTSNEELRERSSSQNTAESPQINNVISGQIFYYRRCSKLRFYNYSLDEILQRIRDESKSQNTTSISQHQTETDGRLLLSSGPHKKKQCESENKYLSLPFIGYLFIDYKRRYPEVLITCDSIQEKEEGFVSIYEILLERGIDMTKTPFNPRRVKEIETALLKYDGLLTSLVVNSLSEAKELRPDLAYLIDNYCEEDAYYFLMGRISQTFDLQEKDTVRNFKDLSGKKVIPKPPKIGDFEKKSILKTPKKRVRFSDDCIDDSNNPK